MNSPDLGHHANIAIWVLVGVSCGFLAVRLFCRSHYSKLWWDDGVLSLSWLLLLVGGALISRLIAVGSASDEGPDSAKSYFFRLHNISVVMTTLATSSSKVAFAVTLTRIARHKLQLCFLWFVIITANLILVPGLVATLVPACVDPRKVYRPVHGICMDLRTLQYLGGSTMVYGGVIDILLALFPWLVLRNLLLDTREKIGLTVAMSLGALTGVVVILRVIFQFVPGDNDFDFMIFMSIFNFLEPSVTIIAQAIPMFRVLFVRQQKMSSIRLTSSPRTPRTPYTPRTPRTGESLIAKPSSLLENEVWEEQAQVQYSRDPSYYATQQNRKYGWPGDNMV